MASYKVGADGKAPSGLKAGDTVVTGGGTYKISGVNNDGSYTSSKVSNTSTYNYNGGYASNPSGGSSGSSSSSRPSGSSGGGSSGGYQSQGTHGDQTISSQQTAQSKADMAKIQQYKDAYNAAQAKGDKAGMQAAHDAAEAIRSGYGYSGGGDGSQMIQTGQSSAPQQTGGGMAGSLAKLVGGVVAPAVANAVKNSASAMGGGHSSSQQNSLPSAATLTTKDIAGLKAEAKANSEAWHTASEEDKKRLHARNEEIYGLLGYRYDSPSGVWDRTGSAEGVEGVAAANDELAKIQSDYEMAQGYLNDANEIKTQQAVDALEAQKYDVSRSGAALNAAAQDAYMQAINPNGGMAEVLAAQGLLPTGKTESSLISSSNAYQESLNENSRLVTEQLSAIERAIVQARQNGDIAAAELLAQYFEKVAAMKQENADRILSFGQWAAETRQNQEQNDRNYALEKEKLKAQLDEALFSRQITQAEHDAKMREFEQTYRWNERQFGAY